MSDITLDIVHRTPEFVWAVVSRPTEEDEWEMPEYLVVKGDGFHFTIVAVLQDFAEAQQLALAMNYWETRPI